MEWTGHSLREGAVSVVKWEEQFDANQGVRQGGGDFEHRPI